MKKKFILNNFMLLTLVLLYGQKAYTEPNSNASLWNPIGFHNEVQQLVEQNVVIDNLSASFFAVSISDNVDSSPIISLFYSQDTSKSVALPTCSNLDTLASNTGFSNSDSSDSASIEYSCFPLFSIPYYIEQYVIISRKEDAFDTEENLAVNSSDNVLHTLSNKRCAFVYGDTLLFDYLMKKQIKVGKFVYAASIDEAVTSVYDEKVDYYILPLSFARSTLNALQLQYVLKLHPINIFLEYSLYFPKINSFEYMKINDFILTCYNEKSFNYMFEKYNLLPNDTKKWTILETIFGFVVSAIILCFLFLLITVVVKYRKINLILQENIVDKDLEKTLMLKKKNIDAYASVLVDKSFFEISDSITGLFSEDFIVKEIKNEILLCEKFPNNFSAAILLIKNETFNQSDIVNIAEVLKENFQSKVSCGYKMPNAFILLFHNLNKESASPFLAGTVDLINTRHPTIEVVTHLVEYDGSSFLEFLAKLDI